MFEPGSSSERPGPPDMIEMTTPEGTRIPDAEEEMATENWRKREMEVLQRYAEEGDQKKAKIGDQYVGALYTPVSEDPDPELDEEILERYEEEPTEGITEEEELQAKGVELDTMDEFRTYEPVPESEAEGKAILDSTWVVVRKPEGRVRARYCLREYKKENFRSGDDIYAVATTSATSRVIDHLGVQHGYVFFTGDATNAFWQVPIDEECYMMPPKEWLKKREEKGEGTNVVWNLKKEWYGRRIAGNRWVEWFAGKLKKNGCDRCVVAPWFFTHPNGIHLEMHMDDIYGCGPEDKVKEFLEALQKDVKMKGEIHRRGDTFKHLKRVRTYAADGRVIIQPDPKHIEQAVNILGLQHAKPAATPAVAGGSQVDEGRKLDEAEAKTFRTVTGILMYISPHRPDAQFAIRELTKSLKEPTRRDISSVIRVVRYLNGTRNYGIEFRGDGEGSELHVYSDTNWASCKKTRKSTACATIFCGGNLLASYSRGLAMICLSSGEAAFNGGVAACSEGLFFKKILSFMGPSTRMKVWLDSSAARGVFQRQGVGRIRHLEAKSLWVQEGLKKKEFELEAVRSEENSADIGTKALNEAKLVRHRKTSA